MTHAKKLSLWALFLGLVLFFALNALTNAALRRARLDLTEDHLFTLSPGSRSVCAKLSDPIALEYYFSEEVAGALPAPDYRLYGVRVKELLQEYVLASDGQLSLRVIEPEAFSEEQDAADSAGVRGLTTNESGDLLYMGLVGRNSVGDKEVIPYFDLRAQRTLEYDVTKLIHNLDTGDKPVVALITTLPMEGRYDPMQRSDYQGPWAVLEQLRDSFEVRSLATSTENIPEDVDCLLLVHPKGLGDGTLYAIDQFVLRGGRAVVFVDPDCVSDQPLSDPSMARMQHDKSSDLRRLFDAWGLELAPGKVAGDRRLGLEYPVDAGGRNVVRDVTALKTGPDQRDAADVVVNGVDQMLFLHAGILSRRSDATTTFAPLVHTTVDSMGIETSLLAMYPDYKKLLTDFVPEEQELVLAARLSGLIESAFPEGKPAPDADAAPAASEPASAEHLAESTEPIQVIVCADADLLRDDMWMRPIRFGGMTLGYSKGNNNADFAFNAVENLLGSNDLISVRSHEIKPRTFTVVEAMEREADEKFLDKEDGLQQRLHDTQARLRELQQGKSADEQLILSPEQEREIEEFRQTEVETNRELRQVLHDRNAGPERLGRAVKWICIGAVPALVGAFAVAQSSFRASRRRR
jgi:ABC-type uncharacterized transport system involved in gliding motility auxiliary subunit